jgi:hypothetical protein
MSESKFKTPEELAKCVFEQLVSNPNIVVKKPLAVLPSIVSSVELTHRKLTGKTKKQIALSVMTMMINEYVKDDALRLVLLEQADDMIDCVVALANSNIFKKTIKRFRCCAKRSRERN